MSPYFSLFVRDALAAGRDGHSVDSGVVCKSLSFGFKAE